MSDGDDVDDDVGGDAMDDGGVKNNEDHMSNSPDFPKTTDLHGEKLPQSWNLSTTRPED